MVFKASLDGLAKAFSTVFTMLLIAIIAWQVYYFLHTPEWNAVIVSAFLLAILFVPFYHHPIRYCVGTDYVEVKRPLKNVYIRRKDIVSICLLGEHDMTDTLRSFGVAGLYGYFGRYSNQKIGSMHWYATQLRNYVLIQTSDKNYILTPDHPEEFMQHVNAS